MSNHEFIALDVETANSDFKSICQIGIAWFDDGQVIDTWKTLIDPQDEFDGINVSIHGITEEDVQGAPTFAEIENKLHDILTGNTVACHGHFDHSAINRASQQTIDCHWLSTLRVSRRAWQEEKRHGLERVTERLNIPLNHHDALADAIACGTILNKAIEHTGITLAKWFNRVEAPVNCEPDENGNYPKQAPIRMDGNQDGVFFGETMVFTGALNICRKEAAAKAAEHGCNVAAGVTKKTTLLVVGDQDIKKLNGNKKSSKHRKAEAAILNGQPIRILCESDFQQMMV